MRATSPTGSRSSSAPTATVAIVADGAPITEVAPVDAGDPQVLALQQAAMAFYRRHGFTDIARFGPYVDSETSMCMERRLP